MMIDTFPPALAFIIGGIGVLFTNGLLRTALIFITPVIALLLIWNTTGNSPLMYTFLNYDLILVRHEPVGRVFATVFALIAIAGNLFSFRQAQLLEISSAFLYAGSAIGVVMAGDLITIFIFWEIMAIGSTMILWSNRTQNAFSASMRYITIHLLGGVILLIGIAAHAVTFDTVSFHHMQLTSFSTWMILFGFLINAGAPPFSAWLPDAYPEASPSGMVYLSAFTTKTAVYVLMQGFAGAEILIYIGLYMACYGIIYALLENDMRRILAYSIINQVGFMICGIGIGTEMSINGATAHAFTHIIYKALLLMSAGSVLYLTGRRKCSDLGGLFQTMPVTCCCGIVGALSISAFPLTSGFISKSMISQAAIDEHLVFVWYSLMAASAGVFLHAGIKFPWFVFFQKDSGLRPSEAPWNMRIAMIFCAIFCIVLGIYPDPLYEILPFEVTYIPYSFAHVIQMLQLLLFSGLAFFLLLPMMKRTLTITIDFDWLYRRLGKTFISIISHKALVVLSFLSRVSKKVGALLMRLIISQYGQNGLMARTQTASAMMFWALAILIIYLLARFL